MAKIKKEVLLTKDGKTKVLKVKSEVSILPSFPVKRLFKVVGRNGAEYFLGQTHEDPKKWLLGRETQSGVRRTTYTTVRFRQKKI